MNSEEIQNNVQGSDSEPEEQNETIKKLSKNQKKKLREKKKKQQAKKAAEEGVKELEKKEEKINEDENSEKMEKKEEKKDEKKDKKKKGGKVNAIVELAKKTAEAMKKMQQQAALKRKKQQEEQQRRIKQEEQRKRKQQQQKQRIEKQEQQRVKKLKKQGLFMNKKQKQKLERTKNQLFQANKIKQQTQLTKEGQQTTKQKNEQELKKQQQKKEKQRKKQQKLLKDKKADFKQTQLMYRSPICCILGHVDTGKTTLLDKIRHTNVQGDEQGGITQQIGATFFPQSKLIEQINKCKDVLDIEVQVPGLLIIDTPGHESFSNLRSRGSSLCDMAILVIDIQHGLENQTLESLELLKKGNTPFVVALNKIDRSYGWEANNDSCSFQSLKKQKSQAIHDYNTKLGKVMLQLNQKGYNADLYWQNKKNDDPQDFISLVPTSGVTGEGIPDLLTMIVDKCFTTQSIKEKLLIKKDRFQCRVMEVKMIEGYGTTIDCLLVEGSLNKDDQIVLLGFQGPITTKIRALLTPHPMKEMRVKGEFLHHNSVFAANGVKIAATGLDCAVAGGSVFLTKTEQDIEEAIKQCKNQLTSIQKKFKMSTMGVGVSASTLGSLQALLDYLKSQKIPVSHISVGPVSKEDVMKAMKAIISENSDRRCEQYACLLVFDIKVLPDAQKYAQENGIKIFTAKIIYHLTDFFNKHVAAIKQARKQKQGKQAVFPCILKQVKTIHKSDPIVLGVDVESGVLKIGTPICVYKQNEKNGDKQLRLGVVESIEHNHKKIPEARKKNGSVGMSLSGDSNILSGRHFQQTDMLVSILSRKSIDLLKEHFSNEVSQDEWKLVIELKKYFNII